MGLSLDIVLKAEFLRRVCLGVPSGRPLLGRAVCAQHSPGDLVVEQEQERIKT